MNKDKVITDNTNYLYTSSKNKINKALEDVTEETKTDPLAGEVKERDSKGKFLPGHSFGKLPREKIYSTEELTQAIREVEEEGDEKGNRIDVLKHYVRRSLKDDRVLIDLIGKHVPKITINEIKGTGLPFNLFVTQFIEEKDIPCEMVKGVISMKAEKEKEKPL